MSARTAREGDATEGSREGTESWLRDAHRPSAFCLAATSLWRRMLCAGERGSGRALEEDTRMRRRRTPPAPTGLCEVTKRQSRDAHRKMEKGKVERRTVDPLVLDVVAGKVGDVVRDGRALLLELVVHCRPHARQSLERTQGAQRGEGVGRTDKDGQLGRREVGLLVLGKLVELGLDVLLELGDGVAEGCARVVDLVLGVCRGSSVCGPAGRDGGRREGEEGTHDDEDAPADQGAVAEGREVEPLGADDLLAELLLHGEAVAAVKLADLLVQRQADGLDGDVAALAVGARDALEEGAEDARGEEAAGGGESSRSARRGEGERCESRKRRAAGRTRRRQWRCMAGRRTSQCEARGRRGEVRAGEAEEGEGERGTDTMMSGSKRSLIWRAVLPMVQWMSS